MLNQIQELDILNFKMRKAESDGDIQTFLALKKAYASTLKKLQNRVKWIYCIKPKCSIALDTTTGEVLMIVNKNSKVVYKIDDDLFEILFPRYEWKAV